MNKDKGYKGQKKQAIFKAKSKTKVLSEYKKEGVPVEPLSAFGNNDRKVTHQKKNR